MTDDPSMPRSRRRWRAACSAVNRVEHGHNGMEGFARVENSFAGRSPDV